MLKWIQMIDPRLHFVATTEGLFQFKVMSFGLCNVPATFQWLMDLVLAGLQWSHCLVYLDTVIVLGISFAGHLQNLQEVVLRQIHDDGHLG